MIEYEPHPLLAARAFVTEFSSPLGEVQTPSDLLAMLSSAFEAPMHATDEIREAVRRLLRHGGFKPSGRSKPASEYLKNAAAAGTLGSINAAVDLCNIVSLHSGLPISVVDLAKAMPLFRVGVAPAGTSYVFNPSGQSIDVSGLICLYDAEGPCGNAVKDAQRTKTDAATTRTLSIIWGTNERTEVADQALTWYRELLRRIDGETQMA